MKYRKLLKPPLNILLDSSRPIPTERKKHLLIAVHIPSLAGYVQKSKAGQWWKMRKKRSFLASLRMSYTLSYPKNLNYGNVRYDLYFHLEPWVKVDFCKKGYFCKFLIFKFWKKNLDFTRFPPTFNLDIKWILNTNKS